MVKAKTKYAINGARVLIKPSNGDKKTEGGVVLINDIEGRNRGEVVAVGIDVRDNRYKVGQQVIYAAEGLPVKIDDVEMIIVEQELVFVMFE